MRKTWVRSMGWEDPLEKGTTAHSSILAWRIPWPIQSMGSRGVGHDWVTFTFTGKDWRQKKKGVAQDEMVRQHHRSVGMNLSKLQEIVKDREPGVLQLMGLQRVGHDWATEQLLDNSLAPFNLYTDDLNYGFALIWQSHMIIPGGGGSYLMTHKSAMVLKSSELAVHINCWALPSRISDSVGL